jgi:hypothetical protein
LSAAKRAAAVASLAATHLAITPRTAPLIKGFRADRGHLTAFVRGLDTKTVDTKARRPADKRVDVASEPRVIAFRRCA